MLDALERCSMQNLRNIGALGFCIGLLTSQPYHPCHQLAAYGLAGRLGGEVAPGISHQKFVDAKIQ
jgi:hypothetical protein